jgi:acetyl esterase
MAIAVDDPAFFPARRWRRKAVNGAFKALARAGHYLAAHEDACLAYKWVVENCAKYGGDPSRIVVAGESAGGNLALAVAVASAYERPEPWAKDVYHCGVQPAAGAPLMPDLPVSNPLRQVLNPVSGWLSVGVAQDIARAYLGANRTQAVAQTLMADPIRVLEECGKPDRPLPPMFSGVGTNDLCCEDVRRLEIACRRLATPATIHYYDNEIHAFHVLKWRANAQLFWAANMKFLRDVALTQKIIDTEARVEIDTDEPKMVEVG